ncbi:mitochondrial amino-acid acetyltransferase [Amylocarpus encephaloides]|uniref:Amino-acid acetyltransferase, mitochondrial n=1 Tax=Amylocarpus encephaloides TaxID=45428 RepID=A0A9P8C285_9HELO|nr:mitochondrial amino-acid acetyltransferase [Amylocarpus encephaloides]
MILQNIALKKGKEVAGHNWQMQTWSKRKKRVLSVQEDTVRLYATNNITKTQMREDLAKEHVKELSNKQKAKKDARAVDKDFFMSVLGSTATKREAKSYLKRFTPSESPTARTEPLNERKHPIPNPGVNLGGFYTPTAVESSPRFVQHPQTQKKSTSEPKLHIALVKLRAPQNLEDETLNGISRTLSQLCRLGLVSIIVLDCEAQGLEATGSDVRSTNWRSLYAQQADRVVAAIDSNSDAGSRLLDNVIGVDESFGTSQYSAANQICAHVTLRKLLMTPLRRGVIPVIPSVAYTDVEHRVISVPASDVVIALTKELAAIPVEVMPDEDPSEVKERLARLREELSLDRLIILDPLGGIPTPNRPNGYHVFLNMEQEFEPAKRDLVKGISSREGRGTLQVGQKQKCISNLGMSNPLSKFTEMEFGGLSDTSGATEVPRSPNWSHLQNLHLIRSVLSILPPSSSAILTTPEEASNSANTTPVQPGGVGTRRHRNPLIHNLLTDKPVFSSSLPSGRLGPASQASTVPNASPAFNITPTTFAKHGMHISIFPDPHMVAWAPPTSGVNGLTLTDPSINLPRLVHLIDDSFGRKLDVNEYLERVNGRIAGVIVAGEYEGGAILTWETPPGVLDDGSPESRARLVPYLDKFAVLKKSQGSGGVADAVFTAMVRDCFPNGVVWRSRTTNVVNKWYFERSRGTWKMPETGWTMFWTTPDMDRQTFLDYEAVCRGIIPSWADNKSILD